MHSLRKAFSEKRGLIVFQNVLLSVKCSIVGNNFFVEVSKIVSLIFMQNIHGEICLLYRVFAPFVLSCKYSFRSFDLFTMVFLRFLVMKLKFFARIIFFFFLFLSMFVKN